MVMLAFAIKPDAVQQSALAPYVTTGTRVIALVMPANLRAQFQPALKNSVRRLFRGTRDR